MELTVVGLVFGVVTAVIASERGRHPVGWFIIGLFLTCIGLILVLVLPNLKLEGQVRERLDVASRRLRERGRKDRQVADTRFRDLESRVDVHDQVQGLDTRSLAGDPTPALPQHVLGDVRAVQWWYALDGERQGPVPFATLKRLYESGSVGDQTLVWCESMEDWARVSDLGDLEDALCA